MFKKISLLIMFLFLLNNLAFAQQQKLYELSEIPIVDMHTHLNGKEEFKHAVKVMDEWGGTISVSVNTNEKELMQFIADSLDSRILLSHRGKEFTPEEVVEMKKQNYSGIKTHLRYHTLASTLSHEQIDKMGEVGLPFIAMHVADPPEDIYYVPEKFMVHQLDAEQLARRHPKTNFIFAHGFYLTNRNSDIDTLRKIFDRNPNIYADICCSKWWDEPEPSFTKIRNLLIDYKDRFMFGTDYGVNRTADGLKFLRERLETNKALAFGNNGGPGPGFALPLDVLNHIYYWNAAKVIPGVKEALEINGFEIGSEPPAPQPDKYGRDYNPQQYEVIQHNSVVKISEKFEIKINLAPYGRAVEGTLEILSWKKKVVNIPFSGKFEGEQVFTWDPAGENELKIEPGKYRAWLILENMKCAETVFVVE
ncbi:MAG: amidohydrolase [Melioribacteraceae bacterium]|nr:amidohydrolase [Melioribacteraceae bacterium]